MAKSRPAKTPAKTAAKNPDKSQDKTQDKSPDKKAVKRKPRPKAPRPTPITGKVLTHSGRLLDLANPDPQDITVNDIAHALSHIPRYNGHTNQPYTVAHHSLVLYDVVQQIHREGAEHKRPGCCLDFWDKEPQLLWCLLHDAAEAYMGDIIAPIRQHWPEIEKLEARLNEAIEQAIAPFETHLCPAEQRQLKALDRAIRTDEMMLLNPDGFTRLLSTAMIENAQAGGMLSTLPFDAPLGARGLIEDKLCWGAYDAAGGFTRRLSEIEIIVSRGLQC